jgi:hypothetical protein
MALTRAAEGLDAAGDVIGRVAESERAKATPALVEELKVLAEEARDVESRVLSAARRLDDVEEPKDSDSPFARLQRAVEALLGQA